MLQKILQQPYLSKLPFANKLAMISASLCLCCCLLLIAMSQQNISQINHKMLNQLGGELSRQLAISARPALIQGDSLSLQSLLVELNNSENIIQAAIFDVENKPVAEAGLRLPGMSFTSTISYQDSIAGYSLIVLNPNHLQTQATGLLLQQLLLSLLFSACSYALILWGGGKISLIFKQLQQLIEAPNYPRNTRRRTIPYIGDDELQQLIQQILKGPSPPAKQTDNTELAALHISLNKQQDLSAEEAQKLLNQYQQQLTIICNLYEGQLEISRPESFTALFFQNKKHNDHPFKALCCGKIIEQLFLNSNSLFSIKIAASLAKNSDDFAKQHVIKKCIKLIENNDKTLSFDNHILEHPSVFDRLDSDTPKDEEDDPLSIQLSEPYKELIDRQFSALRLQFERKENI